METSIAQAEQDRLDRSSEPDLDLHRVVEALSEPEPWQLEDFEDIVPHDLCEFETEYGSITAPPY